MKKRILLLLCCLLLFNCSKKTFNSTSDTSIAQSIDEVVEKLTLGQDLSCILTNTGRVKCWGWNGQGQMGQGHTNNLGDGLAQNGENEMGDNLPIIDLGTRLVTTDIAAGFAHICALFNTHQIKCWGRNEYGQLGQDHTDYLGDNLNERGEK